jgi:hypothetical protein
MLTTFYYAKSIIHHEYVPEKKQIVNGIFNKEVIKRLIVRVYRLRPEYRESGFWYLLHENALAHSSEIVSKFFYKRVNPVLSHLRYSLL